MRATVCTAGYELFICCGVLSPSNDSTNITIILINDRNWLKVFFYKLTTLTIQVWCAVVKTEEKEYKWIKHKVVGVRNHQPFLWWDDLHLTVLLFFFYLIQQGICHSDNDQSRISVAALFVACVLNNSYQMYILVLITQVTLHWVLEIQILQ